MTSRREYPLATLFLNVVCYLTGIVGLISQVVVGAHTNPVLLALYVMLIALPQFRAHSRAPVVEPPKADPRRIAELEHECEFEHDSQICSYCIEDRRVKLEVERYGEARRRIYDLGTPPPRRMRLW